MADKRRGIDIGGRRFDVGIERLAACLPTIVTPSHWLATEGPGRLPDGHIVINMPGEARVALDPYRFEAMPDLLGTVYTNYLVPHFEPYTYGRDWCIRGLDHVVIPIELMDDPTRPVQEVAPAWMESRRVP